MSHSQILLAHSDSDTAQLLERGILRPAGFEVLRARDARSIDNLLRNSQPILLIIGDWLENGSPDHAVAGLDLAGKLLAEFPTLPLIFLSNQHSEAAAVQALRLGITDYLVPPLRANEVLQSIRRALNRRQRLANWSQQIVRQYTLSLQKQMGDMKALQQIGQKITGLLDLDSVLSAVVDASVTLTHVEESSLLLLDETTGELCVRAVRSSREEFARVFRMQVTDTLPWQVLRTAKPILFDAQPPNKRKVTCFVRNLIYVPLTIKGRAIGVLGADNRQGGASFSDYQVRLLSALAEFASVAIENARQYAHSERERTRLESILTNVEDGMIVTDIDGRLLLVNHTAKAALGLIDEKLVGRTVWEVIRQPELLEILRAENQTGLQRDEVTLEDGRVFLTQMTPISGIGKVVTLQDITYLKELDRIKSDFVNTISHDLRSPLTAIMGYVELIDRVAPVTPQQKEFIEYIQTNVQNITGLINDLLDLEQIEAGLDARKERMDLSVLAEQVTESYRMRVQEKNQTVTVEFPPGLPQVFGDSVRLRQMLINLMDNAIKYTPEGGRISIRAAAEDGQFILQVADTGYGIPLADQPYVFDKFYRASNVPPNSSGTGLGLAIVKSIVENHQGRFWLDSIPGQGATFTIILPIAPAQRDAPNGV